MDRESPEAGSNEAHAKLVAECLEELALMGLAAWENQRRAVQIHGRWVSLSKAGRSDIHVILPRRMNGLLVGIHGEIEAKTGQSTQSPKQRAHMRLVRNSGGIYLVVRSRDGMKAELVALGFSPPGSTSGVGP
ncbi:MAG TPA: hypothetical protein VH092_22975 [Urbifossiella sp.]|jgi:hypothetical protein|nr:hypothetical protein [Urbifossiella sp.]